MFVCYPVVTVSSESLRQPSLFAFSWEPDIDRGLVPSYSKTLSIISELGLVCGLAMSHFLDRSSSSTDESHLPCAPKANFTLEFVGREELNDESIEVQLNDDDWLGLYRCDHQHHSPLISAENTKLTASREILPYGSKIDLHLSRCRKTAEYLGVRVRDLVEVVLTHEASHFVSHIGLGGFDSIIWREFWKASSTDVEYIAQAASWVVFSVFKRPRLIETLKSLSKKQSAVYNNWKGFEDKCRDIRNDPAAILGKFAAELAEISGRRTDHLDKVIRYIA
jgi:hypothetical protein